MKTLIRLLTASALLLPALPLFAREGQQTGPAITTVLALWPYIVGLIIILLAFMWFQQFRLWQRRSKEGARRHAARGNQVTMLALLTAFALLMLAAPKFLKRYEKLFTPKTEVTMDPENRTELTLQVEGMTCTGCEGLINSRVGEIPGIESVVSDHMAGQTTVVFDKARTDRESIAQTIADAGYKVVD